MGLREEVLKDILKDPKCYSTKKIEKGKIHLKYVIEQMYMAKEVLYYDEVYWPHLQRFTRKVKAWGIFKTDWETFEGGYNYNMPIEYPVELEYQDIIGDRVQYYLEPIWNDDERWAWAEPTIEECKSLIDIADAEYALVQTTMF